MADPRAKRLRKELAQLVNEPPPGVALDESCGDNLKSWLLHITAPPGSIYQDERYLLNFNFGDDYPFSSPEVTFLTTCTVPEHPHIYSNGHICLSILTEDWTPALGVQSVCLSIMSMLSSCSERKRPPDDAFYIRTCSKNPKNTRWWFHDDAV